MNGCHLVMCLTFINKHKMLNNIAKKLIDKGLVKRQNVWSFWR